MILCYSNPGKQMYYHIIERFGIECQKIQFKELRVFAYGKQDMMGGKRDCRFVFFK